jgi:glutathione S-transferase
MNSTTSPYCFHAFDVSYFSAKVRPALRYKKLWYEEVRADMREIRRRTGLAFIPVLITPDDETWQDSTDIYDRLEERHPDPPLFPASPVHRMAAQLVELYVDEFGITPAMHYRWGSELGEASARARFCAMIGNDEIGTAAAARMAEARLALGATDATGPALEAHTADLWAALSTHLSENAYLLGDRMTFGDCALMGQQYAHFFVDLVSRRLMLETARPVVGWIERCNSPNPDAQGSCYSGGELPETLREVLGAMGRDATPVILTMLREFEDWADREAANVETLPRAVGICDIDIRGTSAKRFVGSYTLFMVQRTLDLLQQLTTDKRSRLDASLSGTGWDELLSYTPRHRIAKKGFDLVFA